MPDDTEQLDTDVVYQVGAQIMAQHIASSRDVSTVDRQHLDLLADTAVTAAMALCAAVPRAREKMQAEKKQKAETEQKEKAAQQNADAATRARTQDGDSQQGQERPGNQSSHQDAPRPAAGRGGAFAASEARTDGDR